MNRYKHTQIGYFLLIVYSVVILFLAYLNILTGFEIYALAGLLVMFVALAIFAKLTVTVGDRKIRIQFGIGIIRKGFHLNDIATYQLVKNPWYYGWGIRYTPRGWLYRVSGSTAIELQMKSGKTYRIGTDDPERLAHALDQALKDAR
jgi:hypothetical protein